MKGCPAEEEELPAAEQNFPGTTAGVESFSCGIHWERGVELC